MKNAWNFLFFLIMLTSAVSMAEEGIDSRVLALEDFKRTEEYYKECLTIKDLAIRDRYKVDCFTNYHHFNSDSDRYYQSTQNSWVEIASFNVWQPGSNASPFKDYELVAKLMNGHDLVAASELLPSVGDDQNHNERVLKFLEETPREISELEGRYSESPRTDTRERLDRLKQDLKVAPSLYRVPGYLLLLDELRKLDPSWSLIIAPSGESADNDFVQEKVGFYYRARVVKPKINEHCHKFRKKRHGPSVACYPKMTKAWSGESIRSVFGRRPFLSSFVSGSFDFSLITSHIVFNAPEDVASMASILSPSYGVSDYQVLGTGATKANYARLAEMKMIMKIMEKIRKESQEKDIIFLGDTNLEFDNPQWEGVLSEFSRGELFVDEPTTVSIPYELSDGTLTNGTASAYDHIIMDLSETTECRKSNGSLSARVGNFLNGNFRKVIDKKYRYRKSESTDRDPRRESMRLKLIDEFKKKLLNRMTIKRGRIVVDDNEVEETVTEFDERVFQSQLSKENYYKVYRDVISDHLPVTFSCRR